MDIIDPHIYPSPNMREQGTRVSKSRIQSILNSSIRSPEPISVGDTILFWRDINGWLGPVIVASVDEHQITFVHNGVTKTSSPAYDKKLPPDATRLDDIIADTQPPDPPGIITPHARSVIRRRELAELQPEARNFTGDSYLETPKLTTNHINNLISAHDLSVSYEKERRNWVKNN